jgi:hypothetical protein
MHDQRHVNKILLYIRCRSMVYQKKILSMNTTCFEIIRRSHKFIEIKSCSTKIMNDEILSAHVWFIYNCFISITLCSVFLYLLLWSWRWLFNQERMSTYEQLEFCPLLFDRIRYLPLLSMFNTYTQNSLDNSSANKACPSSIYFLLSTIETIVCVVFIISDSRWSEKEHKWHM